MKKLSVIIGLALFAVVMLFSCKDESGEFVEQLYTNAQKEAAVKDCLKASADTALGHLCTVDGFYNYYGSLYRIDFEPLWVSLFDTLERHGHGDLADSLILHTNRLAESCKAQLSPIFIAAVDSLVISDYDALINGQAYAITDYFENYNYRFLTSSFQTPVSIRMNLYGVMPLWNEMVQKYAQYTSTPLNFDVQNYVVEKMLDGLIQEMRLEELLIRTDSAHRSESMELLGKE